MPHALPAEPAAEVARRLAAAGVTLEPRALERLGAFVGLLGRWNRVYNLTGLTELGEIVDRHLVESLVLRPLLAGERVADVGSGAGLPGMPLAIVEPRRAFTLIESRAKRVRFLRHVAAALELENVTVAHGRAEHLRPERPFATVLARAVAPPAELLAICRPLTAPGSRLVLLTAAHLRGAYAGIASDFVARPEALAALAGAPPLKSSIVVLERTDGRTDV